MEISYDKEFMEANKRTLKAMAMLFDLILSDSGFIPRSPSDMVAGCKIKKIKPMIVSSAYRTSTYLICSPCEQAGDRFRNMVNVRIDPEEKYFWGRSLNGRWTIALLMIFRLLEKTQDLKVMANGNKDLYGDDAILIVNAYRQGVRF